MHIILNALALQPLYDTSSGQEKWQVPVPASQTGDRSHLGQTSGQGGRRGQVHLEPLPCTPHRHSSCSAARTVLCGDVCGTAHSPVPHCNHGFVRAALLQGGHPARLGVGSFPGLSLQLQSQSRADASRKDPGLFPILLLPSEEQSLC